MPLCSLPRYLHHIPLEAAVSFLSHSCWPCACLANGIRGSVGVAVIDEASVLLWSTHPFAFLGSTTGITSAEEVQNCWSLGKDEDLWGKPKSNPKLGVYPSSMMVMNVLPKSAEPQLTHYTHTRAHTHTRCKPLKFWYVGKNWLIESLLVLKPLVRVLQRNGTNGICAPSTHTHFYTYVAIYLDLF